MEQMKGDMYDRFTMTRSSRCLDVVESRRGSLTDRPPSLSHGTRAARGTCTGESGEVDQSGLAIWH